MSITVEDLMQFVYPTHGHLLHLTGLLGNALQFIQLINTTSLFKNMKSLPSEKRFLEVARRYGLARLQPRE